MTDAETDADDGGTITIRKDFGLFMAALYERSAADNQFVTNQLIDSLTRRAKRAEDTLAAVRFVIGCLMDGDFMPTSAAIERALYPTDSMVDRLREERAMP